MLYRSSCSISRAPSKRMADCTALGAALLTLADRCIWQRCQLAPWGWTRTAAVGPVVVGDDEINPLVDSTCNKGSAR